MGRQEKGSRRLFRGWSMVGIGGALLILALGMIVPVAAQQRAVVKARFQDDLMAMVPEFPTDLAWLEGDLLIVTKDGVVYRLAAGKPTEVPPPVLLDISGVTGTGQEQGMLGVIADPQFSKTKNRFIYAFYTRDEGGCSNQFGVPPPDSSKCFNRVSRFTVPASGPIDPSTEKSVIERIPVGIPNHNGGDLKFAKDGLLYVTTGDGGVDTGVGAEKAQGLGNLHGKILRIRRDGSVPADNPFAGKNSVVCGKTASVTAPKGNRCAEIFAYGLRNPYRFAFDPNAKDTRFFINDVGEETWEEIDLGKEGANYGWPRREGPCPIGEETNCEGTNPKRFAAPVHAYFHSTGCSSITGGAFVPDTSDWGRAYQGTYIFGDFICEQIFVLAPKPNGNGFASSEFAVGEPFAQTAMLFEPRGDILYYTQSNEIRAIQRKD